LIGLLTRLAVIPLLAIMAVALTTATWPILVNQGSWIVAHEARADSSMTLGALFLLIGGGGPWSADAWLRTQSRDLAGMVRWIAVATLGVTVGTVLGSRALARIPEMCSIGCWRSSWRRLERRCSGAHSRRSGPQGSLRRQELDWTSKCANQSGARAATVK
jgi:hypothetical protein